MQAKEERPVSFRIGDLVVISIASKGIQTSISGDIEHTDSKLFWLYDNEYMIGMVVEALSHPDFPLSTLWRILTVEGIAHIWSEDIAEDDLSVVFLTESIGEWLRENCTYCVDTGKYSLAKDLVAVRSFSHVAKAPQLTVMYKWTLT
jgi:hypothetical protein